VYTPWHKYFEVVSPFTATGPAEVKHLVNLVTPLIKGNIQDPQDKRNNF
jgi:hypothetical protein